MYNFTEYLKTAKKQGTDVFCHIVPCFCFIFHLILRLFSAHPDSHLIFSAVAPCVIRHCCQCCQRSHRCNITVQRISHCFQLTCFDFKQDAAFQQAFFADFLFHLCIFKDVVRLKQARIVHTLETINDRPAYKWKREEYHCRCGKRISDP